MLEAFRKKSRGHEDQANEFLEKGMDMLDGGMFKQAMIQFQQAIDTDKKVALPAIYKHFKEKIKETDWEAGLALGLIVIKYRQADAELANLVGNCSRRQKNFKQANSLYRHALKVNPKFRTAFFNLAASMGKVDKYDDEVRHSIETYANMQEYLLPDYFGDPLLMEKLEEELTVKKREEVTERIQRLELELAQAEADDDYLEQRRLNMELDLATKAEIKPEPEMVFPVLEERVRQAEKKENPSLKEMAFEYMNLAIYSISQNDGKRALKTLIDMDKMGLVAEYQTMLKAIAMDLTGSPEDANDLFMHALQEDTNNRYLNLNLGILHRRRGNSLLATKYLAIGASLLEKSDGLYRLSELIKIADKSYEQGNIDKALNLYRIVCNEVDYPEPFMKLGDIHLNRDELEEATGAFHQVLNKDPNNSVARERLREIHDSYFEKAEAFFRDNKYKAASGVFERALSVMRLPETIRKTASVYQVMRKPLKAEVLMKEYEELKEQEKVLQEEKERQSNIILGKAYLKKKHWSKAIEHFEIAFRMKLDKDVFVYLATIYRNLRKTEEMRDLLTRYNRMVEHEEKVKRFAE
ncbi:MAG: hypothetical protein RRB13_01345 [bacterium]|nr:hypothetical protein [bacterium]